MKTTEDAERFACGITVDDPAGVRSRSAILIDGRERRIVQCVAGNRIWLDYSLDDRVPAGARVEVITP